MSLKFSISTAVAAASLSLVGSLHAQTYAGGSTAGNLPTTAEVVPGIAGVTYTAISGTTVPITAGDNIYNAEMYEITLASTVEFTASTTAFHAGANNFDDQLFLLDSSGVGILANDDAAQGGDEASLSTGTTLLAPGNYYLLITGSGYYPIDSTGALLFPNYTPSGGTAAKNGTYAATSTLPIAAYTGETNYGGNYVIALTFTTPVPEPGSIAFVLAGVSGLVLVHRSRRVAAL